MKFIYIMIVLSFLYSCKIHCDPPFLEVSRIEEEEFEYIPYVVGDSFLYVKNQKDTLKFFVHNDTNFIHEENDIQPDIRCSHKGTYFLEHYSIKLSNVKNHIAFEFILYEVPDLQKVAMGVSITDSINSVDTLNINTPFDADSASVSINNVIYNDVYIIENWAGPKIYYTKENGVIYFKDFNHNYYQLIL